MKSKNWNLFTFNWNNSFYFCLLAKIKEIFDDLQDQMEGFKEIADEIKESIFDAIDAAQDAFDEQMDEYEYLGDLIDHNMKVT